MLMHCSLHSLRRGHDYQYVLQVRGLLANDPVGDWLVCLALLRTARIAAFAGLDKPAIHAKTESARDTKECSGGAAGALDCSAGFPKTDADRFAHADGPRRSAYSAHSGAGPGAPWLIDVAGCLLDEPRLARRVKIMHRRAVATMN
jgi:hypothetical protein